MKKLIFQSVLFGKSELLLTSTTKGVVAVGEVDGTKIGQEEGVLWARNIQGAKKCLIINFLTPHFYAYKLNI